MAQWLIMMPNEPRKKSEKLGWFGDDCVVLRFYSPSCVGGERALIPALVLEADGKGLQGVRRGFGRVCTHQAGIHAAAAEGAKRHVAHELRCDRTTEQRIESIGCFGQ